MNKENLIQVIQQIFPLPPQKASEIAASFEPISFSKNDFLLKTGEPNNQYFFLEEGIIRSYTYDLDGNEITTNLFGSKQFVFEVSSFFLRIPSQENFQAIRDCKCYFLDFDKLQKQFHSIPEFREMGRTILVRSFAQFKLRTLSMITDTAEKRYEKLLKTQPEIIQNVPLKFIASYLGITDTSLSRIRKEFVNK